MLSWASIMRLGFIFMKVVFSVSVDLIGEPGLNNSWMIHHMVWFKNNYWSQIFSWSSHRLSPVLIQGLIFWVSLCLAFTDCTKRIISLSSVYFWCYLSQILILKRPHLLNIWFHEWHSSVHDCLLSPVFEFPSVTCNSSLFRLTLWSALRS